MVSGHLNFEVLLDQYEKDPRSCSRVLRAQSVADAAEFLQFAQNAIGTRTPDRGLKFLAGLALETGLTRFLVDLHQRARAEAVTLAQKTAACDPQLSLRLVTLLTGPDSEKVPDADCLSGLDLLDAISEGDSFVSSVLKLLKHENPQVRSKAARFIGSRTQNLAWSINRASENDPRVRADILESLFRVNNDQVAPIFHKNVRDSNNRVVGNALLGLYQLHDASSIPLIYEMAQHPKSNFRNTAAWLMGRTGDNRFSGALAELMRDSDEVVRKQAFKALGEMKKANKAAACLPLLQTVIGKVYSDNGEQHLRAAVRDAAGEIVKGLPGTSFIVKTGESASVVRDYSVQEYEAQTALRVAFLLCLPLEGTTETTQQLYAAIQTCAGLRRSKDRWEAIWLKARPHDQIPTDEHSPVPSPSTTAVGGASRNRFSILNVDFSTASASPTTPAVIPNADRESRPDLTGFLSHAPATAGDDLTRPADRKALGALLESDPLGSKWHFIVLGTGVRPESVLNTIRTGSEWAARLHVITPEESSWNNESLQALTQESGGSHLVVGSGAEYAKACFALCSSLLHHYQINWKGEASRTVTLDVSSESGRGTATYGVPPASVPAC
jgi:hypothetical protein